MASSGKRGTAFNRTIGSLWSHIRGLLAGTVDARVGCHNERLLAKSDLHQEIDRRFREAKIEIAFPQRDLHLCSVDESVVLRPQETNR